MSNAKIFDTHCSWVSNPNIIFLIPARVPSPSFSLSHTLPPLLFLSSSPSTPSSSFLHLIELKNPVTIISCKTKPTIQNLTDFFFSLQFQNNWERPWICPCFGPIRIPTRPLEVDPVGSWKASIFAFLFSLCLCVIVFVSEIRWWKDSVFVIF